ncbi:hypothetical protein E8F06_05815 [Pseudomonas sp. BN411]|nr:hypothetical protein [Pseudomonas sp. BN411]
MTMNTSLLSALALSLFWAGGCAAVQNTDWNVLGNGPDAQYHSGLSQINRDNVAQLGIAWIGEIPSADSPVGNPLVKDGIIFQSATLSRVFATDARTGKLLWSYSPDLDFANIGLIRSWSARVNRGLALSGDLAIVGTGDCRLVALDQKTGKVVWQTPRCDETGVTGITGAPRVGGGKVFIGNNCGDSGLARGFVDAYDERTGRRLWRFHTVPDDPSKPQADEVMTRAAATWGKGWAEHTKGCGSVWDSITYDAELEQVYIGTGGPSPWNPTKRGKAAGDELYTNAVVALDAKTGKYLWHYTVTPNDGWNLEASAPIVVGELPVEGKPTRVVMSAPKNGFFYVLNARTGKFISARNPLPVTWALGIDPKTGRPIPNPDAEYWKKPGGVSIVVPGPSGMRSWSPMAFDPASKTAFASFDYLPVKMTVDNTGNSLYGVENDIFSIEHTPGYQRYSELVAWDPIAQAAKWRVKLPSIVNGGVVHTAGGLVFEGTSTGEFNAYDDRDGTLLWSHKMAGGVRAAPSTVMVDGEQYVIVPVGNNNSSLGPRYFSKVVSTPENQAAPSRIVAFKIGGKLQMQAQSPRQLIQPDYPEPDSRLVEKGKVKFDLFACNECHGRDVIGSGGSIPDLRFTRKAMFDVFDRIVQGGLFKSAGMPEFADATVDDLSELKAYIQSRAWEDYKQQR